MANIRRVSGHGYGYAIDHDGHGGYLLTLWHAGSRPLFFASFDDACHMGELFAHACNQYWKVQRINAAHAAGYATIGAF